MAASRTGASLRSRRLVAVLSALLVLTAVAGQPVVASPRASAPAASPAAQHPARASSRPTQVERRGHVSVERLPARSGSGPSTSSGGLTTAPSPVAGRVMLDTTVAPDQATTNATTPPSLTNLPVKTGNADTPNPVVAVGPDDVAWSDDGMLTITDRQGGSSKTVSFFDLFLLPEGTENQQGQIYFDPRHGRWIAVESSNDCFPGDGVQDTALYGHGYLDFAVSDTGDPNGGWQIYYYTVPDGFLANVGFGSSADKIALTSQFSEIDAGCSAIGQASWDVTAIAWTGLLSGSFEEAYFAFHPSDEDEPEWIAPSIRRDDRSNTLYLFEQVHVLTPAEDHQTWLMWITGVGSAAVAQLNIAPVPSFGSGPAIPQGASSFTPAYGPTAVVAQDDRVVAVMTESCTPTGDSATRNCARVVDLTTSTNPATRRQDFYIAANGKDTFSPGAGFAENDDLVITYQQSTSAAGPTAYVVRQKRTDGGHTVSAPVTLISATGLYQNMNGAERMGLQPDPLLSDAVWVINQAGGTTAPDTYRIRIAQARTAVGSTYVPIDPVRVLDSRDGTGLTGKFTANVPRTFSVAGTPGIPPDAVAITGNVTVTQQNFAGYVSVTPTPTSSPTSATINFPVGDTRGNNTTIPLGAGGKLSAVYKAPAGKTTHLIVDVTGYFVANDTGFQYHPVTPARILDSRASKGIGLTGRFRAGVPRAFTVWGKAGVPSGAFAVTGNLSVVNQTQAGYITVLPVNDPAATESSLNFPLGDVRGNGLTARLNGTGKFYLTYKAGPGSTADLIFDVTGYYGPGAGGLRFYPLNPARIMDTRQAVLTQLSGAFSANVSRTLVTGGHFGVPNDGKAVTGNLTVVGQTQAGYIGITLTAVPTPPVSSLNFPLGDVRGNGITVPLNGANDVVLIYKAGGGAKTHLVMDLTGYFR
jgi:hypothetical protein